MRDAELISALAKLVEERPSRGFWKCSDQPRKKRPDWNPKRIYRVYKAMRLNLRRAAKRRLPKRERVPLYVPRHPDTVWSMDFKRFNRTFREEVLDQHLFARLEDVRDAAHWWMIDYNEIRPHDSLSGMSPVEYRTAHARSSTFEMSA